MTTSIGLDIDDLCHERSETTCWLFSNSTHAFAVTYCDHCDRWDIDYTPNEVMHYLPAVIGSPSNESFYNAADCEVCFLRWWSRLNREERDAVVRTYSAWSGVLRGGLDDFQKDWGLHLDFEQIRPIDWLRG